MEPGYSDLCGFVKILFSQNRHALLTWEESQSDLNQTRKIDH